MRVAIVYTAKSDELEKGLAKDAARLMGNDVEIVSYQDLSALKESAVDGYVSSAPAARYAGLILQAIADGADKVLSTCCFMGDIVRALQPFADYAGVPVASIDEGMCRHAALECEGVALLFTSPIAGARCPGASCSTSARSRVAPGAAAVAGRAAATGACVVALPFASGTDAG